MDFSNHNQIALIFVQTINKTLPKAQRTLLSPKVMSQVGQDSLSESRPNLSFLILTKLLAQYVDQSLATKSGPNFSLQIFTKSQTLDTSKF